MLLANLFAPLPVAARSKANCINIIHRAPSPCKQSRNKDKNAKYR